LTEPVPGAGAEAPHAGELPARLIRRLVERGETLAVAESCTGGGLGHAITAVPGASGCFWGGVVAYHNRAKMDVLSVRPETLERYGAVSEETAREMAAGAVAVSGSTWGVAITGIAGPAGATPGRPVGTVCLSVDGPAPRCRTLAVEGDRRQVRIQAVEEALRLLEEAVRSR
jgi:PncC family amidohydrolase